MRPPTSWKLELVPPNTPPALSPRPLKSVPPNTEEAPLPMRPPALLALMLNVVPMEPCVDMSSLRSRSSRSEMGMMNGLCTMEKPSHRRSAGRWSKKSTSQVSFNM